MVGPLRRLLDALRGRGRSSDARSALPHVPTGPELVATVDALEADAVAKSRAGLLPDSVVARVRRICATVRDTVPRMHELGAGSPEAHSVMATATSYLPESLGAYLRLPRSFADRRPVDGGKTSLMVLVDQLDLLAATMDDISDAASRSDAAALVAHGRFLAEKFGHSSLDVGPGTGLTGTAGR